jgi:hypothetical protein
MIVKGKRKRVRYTRIIVSINLSSSYTSYVYYLLTAKKERKNISQHYTIKWSEGDIFSLDINIPSIFLRKRTSKKNAYLLYIRNLMCTVLILLYNSQSL